MTKLKYVLHVTRDRNDAFLEGYTISKQKLPKHHNLSPTPFLPLTLLDKNISKSNSSSLSSSDKIIQSRNSLFSLLFLDKKI